MQSANGGHGRAPRDTIDQLRQEFVDEAVETLQSLDVGLDSTRHGRKEEPELVAEFRRAAVRLRGQAANLGLRALSTVCHRLYEYLSCAPDPLPPRACDDLQAFVDLMTAMAEGRKTADVPAALVRALPRHLGFELADIEIRNVEVMLVMPHGAQTHFVERELKQCGYRVSMVHDTLEAFPLVVQTMPDLIIVSAVMPHLDGIDLTIAINAMPATRNIPIAVITSLAPDDDRLRLLPKKVPVLHKGPTFGDDLFRALDNLFLI